MALFTHYPASILLPSGPLFSYCSWGSQGRNTEAVCHSLLQWHYFANKGLSSQGYGFSSGHVWMWESWTVKKAERWRIDAFELCCWRRLLRVPRTAQRSSQSILKEISPEYSLEGLMLKLILQYFGHLLQARLQQYVNHELPDVQAGFRKGKGTRDQIANICWIMEKAREFQKNTYFCFIDYAKAFDCVDHKKLWKTLKRDGNTRPPDLPLEKPICRSGSNS